MCGYIARGFGHKFETTKLKKTFRPENVKFFITFANLAPSFSYISIIVNLLFLMRHHTLNTDPQTFCRWLCEFSIPDPVHFAVFLPAWYWFDFIRITMNAEYRFEVSPSISYHNAVFIVAHLNLLYSESEIQNWYL